MLTVKHVPAFIVAMLAIGSIIWYAESKKAETGLPSSAERVPIAIQFDRGGTGSAAGLSVEEKSRRFEPAIEISSPDAFLNATPFTLKEHIGKEVILVDFWTYSCINCQRTIPYLNAWHEKYADKGLLIVGLHTPEFEFEKELPNVRTAVEKFGIKYPVVMDNDFSTWRAYRNQYWPRKYLIDIDGYIVYDHIGEGGYEETEKKIQDLLAERSSRLGLAAEVPPGISEPKGPASVDPRATRSPEIYFGAARNGSLGNGVPGRVGEQYFEEPMMVLSDTLYLVGQWDIAPEFAATPASVGSPEIGSDRVNFRYRAESVYLVAGVADENTSVEVEVLRDSKSLDPSFKGADVYFRDGRSFLKIESHRLYKLIEDGASGEHLLELIIGKPGIRFFTFTFG